MRSMVASRMAQDTQSWVDTFKRHNSGTYNNQYTGFFSFFFNFLLYFNKKHQKKTVMDLAKFIPGMPRLPEKFIQIAEQIPGEIVVSDVTQVLDSQLFWPSFNVPYSEYVRRVSGYNEMLEKHPNLADSIDYVCKIPIFFFIIQTKKKPLNSF